MSIRVSLKQSKGASRGIDVPRPPVVLPNELRGPEERRPKARLARSIEMRELVIRTVAPWAVIERSWTEMALRSSEGEGPIVLAEAPRVPELERDKVELLVG